MLSNFQINDQKNIPWLALSYFSPLVQARLVLGVPTDKERKDGYPGHDTVGFNAHR